MEEKVGPGSVRNFIGSKQGGSDVLFMYVKAPVKR